MKLEVEMTSEQLNLLILSTEVYAREFGFVYWGKPELLGGN